MATVLIPTIQQDVHAAAVALVLEEMGHRPIRWFCQDLPEAAAASFTLGRGQEGVSLREGTRPPVDVHDTDVLWHGRVGDPVIRGAGVEPSDRQVASNETRRFVRGILRAISDTAFSVNNYQSSLLASNKLYQLHVAKQLGFSLPETLISNDPATIKAFLREHEETGTIFKSFEPVTWDAGQTAAMLYTHKVTLDMLPPDPMLQLSPGIFQAYVPKAFELRVTAMGAEMFSAKLDSQCGAESAVDWREVGPRALPTTAFDLPEEVASGCRRLLRRLGLVFGCFDFIVTPDGDYVFLEVNQMGQFLWIEESIPDYPLLQAFCELLVSRDPEFRYSHQRTKPRFSFANVLKPAFEMVKDDLATHVMPNEYRQLVRE